MNTLTTSFSLRPISGLHRGQMLTHLTSLCPDDLSLRFGHATSFDELSRYVHSINLNKDVAIGLFSSDGVLCGLAHGATYSADGWPVMELGFSVNRVLQGKGFGQQLLSEVMRRAKVLGVIKLVVQTLSHNQAVRRILNKMGGQAVCFGDEMVVEFDLAPQHASHQMTHRHEHGVFVIEKMTHPNAKTVLFVHGAGGDAWQWRWRVMPELSESGVNSVAISLPSGQDADDSAFESSLRLIEHWHRRLGPSTSLAAHSMGGFLLQHHLARTQTKSHATLIASLPPFNVGSIQGSLIDSVSSQLTCPQAQEQLSHTLQDAFPVPTHLVQAPLKWIAGKYDRVVPLAWQEISAHHYRAPLHVLAGGHNLMLGDPASQIVSLLLE
jgi:pimeloyl-ACP methyl ester carboxylesterase/GNAT superfamily N-acetyltransferase